MNYALLRQEGIHELERMAGGQWTDFNAHDPGITILEQLCYALTDLGYRTEYDIPDLLAGGGSNPYESLHPPAEILTSRPVTPADLRRLVLDVEGVKNAWVEPLEEDALALYYHPDKRELSLMSAPPPTPYEPVKLKGLYSVLIEQQEGSDRTAVRASVARCLHQNRGLCEDFAEITVLAEQKIRVDAAVEIGQVDDPDRVGREIVQKIAGVISPPVPFSTLQQVLEAKKSLDEIFEGPWLEHGFIPDDVLERATRSIAVNTSDLVRAIMDVAGLRAVSRIRISKDNGNTWEGWSLKVEPLVAKLDRWTITLRREGKTVACVDGQTTSSTPPASAPSAGNGLALPAGRDRNTGRYVSVQQHFPALYGIGELGLAASATPERKAQAKQLKAYLMFFDQLMANYLAQLARVKDLFSYDGAEMRTYFAQPLDEADVGLEAPAGEIERKSRFLNHLLARFAEVLDDHGPSLQSAPEAPTEQAVDLSRRKQAFLRRYPRLSGARGTAFDYLAPAGEDNRSGLEERLRLKLGLAEDETFVLVEHILLRPMESDENQQVPLLSAALHKDPYSLQLSFVFRVPHTAGRFQNTDFRTLAEQTIRAETPAHLTPYVRWLDDSPSDGSEWKTFQAAHAEWLERHREHWVEMLGVNVKEPGS
jgi:hypothetical protein